ncbi:G-protein coupled receptor 6 [Branchiostoma belcheri]|nr:G-protein coupled receptor 6 [Branchiostoma belcheri]
MNYRGNNYIGAVLLILLVTVRYAQIPLASGQDIGKETGDKAVSDNTSSAGNTSSSSADCNTAMMGNISEVGENFSSNAPECPRSPGEAPYYPGIEYFKPIAAVTIGLGLWSCVANSLPLAAISKHEHLHSPAYILMANLAASDVMTGLSFVVGTSTTVYYIYVLESPLSKTASRVMFTSIFLSGLSSAYSLMALTAERYWFIVHGMTYINNVTNDKCKVVIALVWAWSGLLAMPPILGWRCDEGCLPIGGGLPPSYVVVVLVFVFIPMAAIILLNMGVLWCLWKHVNAISAQEAAVGAQPSIKRKSGITLVIITIVFLVGWLPIFIRMAMFTDNYSVLYRMMVFIVMNSAINPVVYGFRLKEHNRYLEPAPPAGPSSTLVFRSGTNSQTQLWVTSTTTDGLQSFKVRVHRHLLVIKNTWQL